MARWDPLLVIHRVVSVCQSFRPVARFFFPIKVLFFLLFSIEKVCSHIDVLNTFPGDTDHIYMGLWSNFNCSSMNPMMHRQTDKQTDNSYIIVWILHVDLFVHIFIFLINKNIITLDYSKGPV